MTSPRAPGTSIGHYEITQVLRAGGTATVYEAIDGRDGAMVALKVLHPHLQERPHFPDHLRLEARVAALLKHRGSVGVLALCEHEGVPFLVVPRLEGEDLGQRIAREGTLEAHEVVSVLGAVLDVLGAAHALGIVHRDLKPANIFLSRERGAVVPKVLDFGVALVGDTQHDPATTHRLRLGTLRYMAPEQLIAPHRVEPRSDLFSVGVIAYVALTGRYPWDAATPDDYVAEVTRQQIRPLRALRPDVMPGLDEAIRRALRPWPEERHASAEAMGAAMRAEASRDLLASAASTASPLDDEPTDPVTDEGGDPPAP